MMKSDLLANDDRQGSRIKLGWAKLKDLLAEPNVQDLILAYYNELSPLKGLVPLDPNWDELAQRETADIYRVWAARVDGTLAGFISFHIIPHFAHRSTLFAIDGGHFLHPAWRDKGMVGWRMWRSVEPELRKLGVKVVLAHDNAARPLLPFFLALGYEPRSTMFWKVL